MAFLLHPLLGSCSNLSDRKLDPDDTRVLRASLKYRYIPGHTSVEIFDRIEPGDIIAFRDGEASSDGSVMMASAFGGYSHVGIVYPFFVNLRRVLTADSDVGVTIKTVDSAIAGREFFVYAFPPGTLNLTRLAGFARQAEIRGTFDYDWSAACLGLNSNLTPNILQEVGNEYTCATVVAAALHFSGLSLERACGSVQFVAPGDILHSRARKNLNYARGHRVAVAGGGRRVKGLEKSPGGS